MCPYALESGRIFVRPSIAGRLVCCIRLVTLALYAVIHTDTEGVFIIMYRASCL